MVYISLPYLLYYYSSLVKSWLSIAIGERPFSRLFFMLFKFCCSIFELCFLKNRFVFAGKYK